MTDHDLHTGDGPRADRPKRRTFAAAYKLRVIEEYDAASPEPPDPPPAPTGRR